ncbi:29907_t:CDS:2, partial [Gigaspora margarita]
MKKAFNLVLNFGFKEELINMITLFVNQKIFIENINNETAYIRYAMNPQNSNLRIPLSNIDPNNSYAM